MEYLTDEICKKAQEYIRRIDDIGGALAAIEQGFMQSEIQESAYRFQKAIEIKRIVVVGVNAFETKEEMKLERLSSRSQN